MERKLCGGWKAGVGGHNPRPHVPVQVQGTGNQSQEGKSAFAPCGRRRKENQLGVASSFPDLGIKALRFPNPLCHKPGGEEVS